LGRGKAKIVSFPRPKGKAKYLSQKKTKKGRGNAMGKKVLEELTLGELGSEEGGKHGIKKSAE